MKVTKVLIWYENSEFQVRIMRDDFCGISYQDSYGRIFKWTGLIPEPTQPAKSFLVIGIDKTMPINIMERIKYFNKESED